MNQCKAELADGRLRLTTGGMSCAFQWNGGHLIGEQLAVPATDVAWPLGPEVLLLAGVPQQVEEQTLLVPEALVALDQLEPALHGDAFVLVRDHLPAACAAQGLVFFFFLIGQPVDFTFPLGLVLGIEIRQ